VNGTLPLHKDHIQMQAVEGANMPKRAAAAVQAL
jgi:hypothetical protein